MNNQQIINNAPEGATHVGHKYYMLSDGKWFYFTDSCPSYEECVYESEYPDPKVTRSLDDIRRIVELEKRNQSLLSLTIRMVDRWWCFVHGSLSSETARNLHKEATETINNEGDLLDKRDLEQQAKGVEDLKVWLCGYLSAVDLSDTAMHYIEERADHLHKQAEDL